MKFRIEVDAEPINIIGSLEVVETFFHYRYYIDDKLVPHELATVIRAGLEVLGAEYLNKLYEAMGKP